MIVFGCSITDPDMYDMAAGPGIKLAAEADSQVFAHGVAGSIYRSYNLLLDRAAEVEDLDALVLVHQDSEITDPDFCAKIRAALSDPEVGVVGACGAIGVRSIAWWEGSVTWASFIHRYYELGGGDLPAFAWDGDLPAYARIGEVETVDGFTLVLSPWVVRNVRFDESLGALHGYDFDFCLSVREAGKKVVTADLKVIHHHSLDLVSNPDTWIAAHMAIAEKWDGRMPGVGTAPGDWKERARHAEALAECNKALQVAANLKYNALAAQHQRDLELTTTSISWRITAPLRKLNAARRRLLGQPLEPASS
ncbi:MAG: hypothetical protein QOG68_401 [Solirubrobacteraceae bacterium]|jgi:hypothetical protein|nr:hypothetical protein [Solirubrobacteraceae bacterium]